MVIKMNKQKEEYIIEQLTKNLDLFLWKESYLKARYNIETKELRRCRELAREKISKKYGEIIKNSDIIIALMRKDLENDKWGELIDKEGITEETAKILNEINPKV